MPVTDSPGGTGAGRFASKLAPTKGASAWIRCEIQPIADEVRSYAGVGLG
jgi:hypothetical protein